jgi:hypothetical protein
LGCGDGEIAFLMLRNELGYSIFTSGLNGSVR